MEVCYLILQSLFLLIITSETLCMKGLVVTHMGKREEGLDLVKKGVRLDLTSHICWHVFGLIQKADKKYEEALKSYTQALKYDRVCTIPFALLQSPTSLLTPGKYESFTGFCTASDPTTVIWELGGDTVYNLKIETEPTAELGSPCRCLSSER